MSRKALKKKLEAWQDEIGKLMTSMEKANRPSDDDLLGELGRIYDAIDTAVCGELLYN